MERCFYVADSKTDKGLFAKRDIKTGELILISSGRVLRGKKYEQDFSKKSRVWTQVDKLAWLDDTTDARFLNHSCSPNSGLFGSELIAIHSIKKCEEITCDYDSTIGTNGDGTLDANAALKTADE